MKVYPIFEIEADIEFPESLGTKEKFWITHHGKLSLLKFGRENTGEDWAEKAACELCRLLGLPGAHYDFATFAGRRGVVSPTLVEDGGRLILGNELISQVSKDYDGARSYLQREHTVSRVFAALKRHSIMNYQETWHDFLGYLMLDGWIGNTDRHHENWGLIRAPTGQVVLAPTFDHASSLGRELSDDTRRRRLDTRDMRYSITAFADKARSALFADPTDKQPLSPIDAFTFAARVQRGSGFYWLDQLRSVSEKQVTGVFDKMPDGVMTDAAKEFACALLATNRNTLLSSLRNDDD
ncbi:MAG: HipA domain-containing protein [Rhizobiaceae bacterium]|nr:HipA domain-containing protein [Rhizobiaceae bacterium]